MPKAVDRYRWQQAICSERGPPHAITRLVLLAISLHMDSCGMNAWPSQATIAKRAFVSRRSVITRLEHAAYDGWIERYEAGRNGKGWRLDGYAAVVPDDVYLALPERPWKPIRTGDVVNVVHHLSAKVVNVVHQPSGPAAPDVVQMELRRW